MKKLALSLALILGLTLAANAVQITTSCGTSYDIPNDQFDSVIDMIDVALALDDIDCG
ncbi:hypothetical protein [Sphingobacterium deserti]|uniref:Uncharacterized protein n=1 Tax=Sphingobacterium deserti TaxID=1229276 RepID=A0A0B8T152_9SPHI|nr:hypothetical protein [Sphingobacterium deserti]KGE14557.1 hypothetical protein DI53_1586 [Sphingobacterium deserti]